MRLENLHLVTPAGTLLAEWSEAGLRACHLRPCEQAAWHNPSSSQLDQHCSSGMVVQADNSLGSDEKPGRQQDLALRIATAHQKKKLTAAVQHYFLNGTLPWQLDDLDWSGISEFQRAVLEACFRIPTGQTRTYGQLAAQAGRPKAARAVGRTMAGNRWPLIIPCHRVVGSQGQLIGYSGGQGIATKKLLLDFEAAVSSGVDPVSLRDTRDRDQHTSAASCRSAKPFASTGTL